MIGGLGQYQYHLLSQWFEGSFEELLNLVN
jgi:hypothetical protein